MKQVVNPCFVCGNPTSEWDCVETIEEWLCWKCASGIGHEDEDDDMDEDFDN